MLVVPRDFRSIECYVSNLSKTKLQKEGNFFLIQLFARDILLMKRLEIEETKTSSTFKTDNKSGPSFFDFQLFH